MVSSGIRDRADVAAQLLAETHGSAQRQKPEHMIRDAPDHHEAQHSSIHTSSGPVSSSKMGFVCSANTGVCMHQSISCICLPSCAKPPPLLLSCQNRCSYVSKHQLHMSAYMCRASFAAAIVLKQVFVCVKASALYVCRHVQGLRRCCSSATSARADKTRQS